MKPFRSNLFVGYSEIHEKITLTMKMKLGLELGFGLSFRLGLIRDLDEKSC